MPQKRNPVPIEHLRLLASLAAGRAETAIMTMHNTPFTDMNDGEGETQGAWLRGLCRCRPRASIFSPACCAPHSIDATRVATNIRR